MYPQQIHNRYYLKAEDVHTGEIIEGVCALGAAYAGIFGSIIDNDFLPIGTTLDHQFEYLLHQKAIHPIKEFRQEIGGIIISLNDEYYWSREKIAEWVSQYEDD